MAAFKLTDELIEAISSTFELPREAVRKIYNEYNTKINSLMPQQYLGHSIRSMEQFVHDKKRKEAKKRNEKAKFFFQIRCNGYKGCPRPTYFMYNETFVIFYPSTLDEKEVRMIIAHELGHLFFNTKERNTHHDELEAVANVFGYLLLLGRNNFYSSKKDPFEGYSWRQTMKEYESSCGAQVKVSRKKSMNVSS
jgi:predicted SprT family Zn-dependent metalloprotease